MRRLGWFLLALAACKSDPKDFMVGGGGGGGGGGGADAPKVQDAAKAAVLAIDANMLDGRVCLVDDANNLTDTSKCATTTAGGLTVRLGSQTALTGADGTFSIVNDPAAQPVWRVTGTGVVSSFAPLGNYYVPALTSSGYTALRTANTVNNTVPGQGDVMVLHFQNGQGVAGATANSTSTPAPLYSTFYSTGMAKWAQQTATDLHGMAWLPGIDVGNVNIASVLGTTTLTSSGVPVYDQGLTFVQVIFP